MGVAKARSPRHVHQGMFTKARSPRRVHQGAFTKARSPRRVHQGAFTKARSPRRVYKVLQFRCGLSYNSSTESFSCGGHAGRLLPQSAWQLISDCKAVFWHHSVALAGKPASSASALVRRRMTSSVLYFVDRVWMRRRIDSSAAPTRGSTACKSIRSLVNLFPKETHNVDRHPVSDGFRVDTQSAELPKTQAVSGNMRTHKNAYFVSTRSP